MTYISDNDPQLRIKGSATRHNSRKLPGGCGLLRLPGIFFDAVYGITTGLETNVKVASPTLFAHLGFAGDF